MRICFSLIFSLLISSAIPAQKDQDRLFGKVPLDSFVHSVMEREHIPGLSVAIVRNNQPVLSKGYGFSNLEHGIKATDQTIYGIASVTKVFTAMAVLVLVEDGKLALSDTIGQFLAGIPVAWRPITIRQLLNHTSGISSFSTYQKIPCPVGKDVREYVRGDAWKEVACLPLEFPPGEDWSYGDTGYYLLGLIIEQVSGKKYEEFLKKRIFDPLGMNHTRLMSYRELIPGRADGYSFENNQYTLAPRFEIDEFANGGIVSSVSDMARLHVAFTSERILKKKTWQDMWSKTALSGGRGLRNYGLGFGLSSYKGKERVGHNGGGGLGFSTALTHFPGEGVTVILLTNVNLPEGRSGALANEIASFYFR